MFNISSIPTKVIGQDEQVLVKNGSPYHCIHSCSLQLINNPPQQNNLSQSNKHNNTHPFNNQSISAENKLQSYDTNSELSDNPANNHNVELMPSHSSHSSENPTHPSYPSENSLQPPYQPECLSQSTHPFQITTQRSDSSQSSQPETLKPNISPQHSQSIKKLKPHSTTRYKLINDSNWINAEIINNAGKATGKYSNCLNISSNDGQRLSTIFQKLQKRN